MKLFKCCFCAKYEFGCRLCNSENLADFCITSRDVHDDFPYQFRRRNSFKGAPSGVRDGVNWLFFVREFVKMKKIVREFVKTISFVIRETKKYRS